MIKRVMLCTAFALAILGSVGASSDWEGSAVIGRYGAFPSEGYYGASNSFSRNSVVTVTSIHTGRSVDVIITGRVSEPGVFISLSRQAAEELGIERMEPVRVRVSPLDTSIDPVIIPDAAEARPFSRDPDVNPFATADDQPLFTPYDPVAAEPEAAPRASGFGRGFVRTAGTVSPARAARDHEEIDEAVAARPEPEVATDPAEEPPAEEPPAEEPATVVAEERNRMEAAVAEVRGRTPPRELHPPPRDEEVYTFLDVPGDLPIARAPDREPDPDEADPDTPIVERPAVERLGRIEERVHPLIAEIDPAEPPTGDPADEDGLILRLEPAEPRPPMTVDEWALAHLPLAGELEASSYYLQLGAYSSPRSARNVIDRFSTEGYPFIVTAVPREDSTLYRVYVGPLVRDETGIVLRQVRARGFRDAFVRRGGA